MKTSKIAIYAMGVTLLAAMAGCDKNGENADRTEALGVMELRFAPTIVPCTRATGTAFEEGDAVGLYCVETTVDPAAAIVGERHINNKELVMTMGSLTGTTPCFWPTAYTGPSDFYAYFPYNEKGLSADKQLYEISVALDQSDDEAFRTSDHMLARAQNTARTEEAIPLDFKRLMSLLDFELLPGTGYSDPSGLLGAQVRVMNVAQVANVDFVSGEVSDPSISVNLTPHGTFRASEGKAVGVEAIIPPQQVAAHVYLFNVRIGERNFRCTTDKALTFEPGKRYTFSLTINRSAQSEEVALSPVIEDWTTGAASDENTVEVDPDEDVKLVRDIDGNEYPIVRIGSQQWLGANLRTRHFNDGTAISYLEDQDAWAACENSEEAACCVYGNDPANGERYGLLYNWHAIHTGKLCPEGWHVPSVDEWEILNSSVGGETGEAGAVLKAVSGWCDTWGDSKPEYQGTDEYGFTALPGGARKDNGFETLGSKATWWTTNTTAVSSLSALYARLDATDQVLSTRSSWGKETGCSVRCVKD